MFRTLFSLFVVLIVLNGSIQPLAAEPAAVSELLDAKTDYVADFYLTSGRYTYNGSVQHAPGRERRDFGTVKRSASSHHASRHR